jgi:exportin-2 (importin alpha re-exporter)
MELNPETLQFLCKCFHNIISPASESSSLAISSLSEAADRPNYALTVLQLIGEPYIDEKVRQAAAVNFKDHIRLRWSSKYNPIIETEKEQIKALIIPLMRSATSKIQFHLSEALTIISNHDFSELHLEDNPIIEPEKDSPDTRPSLVSSLQKLSEASDYASINGILGTANSIYRKLRFHDHTDDQLLDLKFCLDNFTTPLLEIFLKTASLIDDATTPATDLRPLFESQKLCCEIFYSLSFHSLRLPDEFFEHHLSELMTEYRKYLTTTYPSLERTGHNLVDELRAAVCENADIFIRKFENKFHGRFLNDFTLAVFILLENLVSHNSTSCRDCDQLAVTAIKFLTTVSTSLHHHTLFAADGIIPQKICQGIVIPNVRLRQDDVELFEMNHIKYIKRDMEGREPDTRRRRIGCDLLKGIATHYADAVRNTLSAQIQSLLTSFAANPVENWKDKDCAIYLVVSLSTKRVGTSFVIVSTGLVDLQSFFQSVILPELQSPEDVNGYPMLKADALKFFTMFLSQVSKHVALRILPDLVRFLAAESNVVHSYAASCIEKLLSVKDEGGTQRYSSADISPIFTMLMNNLFSALKLPKSGENQYVMKCIMRVLGVADIQLDAAQICIEGLGSLLSEACQNPKNRVFNYYLFESVAIFVKRASERDPSIVTVFETKLFPRLEIILTNDGSEFQRQIFGNLLSPHSWRRASNVPVLVHLLHTFLQKAPNRISQVDRLTKVLGLFDKLIQSVQGFYVLNTVFESLEYGVIEPYISHIWAFIFRELQKRQTVKFLKSLLIFISLFLIKHGSSNVVDTMNTVQPDIFIGILTHFWIPNLKLITGDIELKLTAVASTRLICESPVLLDPAASVSWGKMVDSIVTLLSRPEQDTVEDKVDILDITVYSAGRKEDPIKDIRDPREFFVASLSRLCAKTPGRYPNVIGENVTPVNQAALLQLCNTYNLSLV